MQISSTVALISMSDPEVERVFFLRKLIQNLRALCSALEEESLEKCYSQSSMQHSRAFEGMFQKLIVSSIESLYQEETYANESLNTLRIIAQ